VEVVTMIEAQLKTIDPETVAFISMHGPYTQIPEAMGRLYGWVGQRGIQPVGMPAGVYLSDPGLGQDTAIWELRTPIAEDLPEAPPDETDCGIKHLDPRTVAYAMHRGPYEGIGTTYGELAMWIEANGYKVVGPPEELYFSDPDTTAPADYLTEIRFPVARR
jgi:effector-binding domain-containing protein